MHAAVVQALADVDEEHLDLRLLPAQPLAQRPLGDGAQALHQDHAQEPDALLPLAAVLGPPADGQLVPDLGDVVVARAAEPRRQPPDHVQVQPEVGQPELQVVAEVPEGVGRGVGQGGVVGPRPVGHLLELDVAAWFQVSVCGEGERGET